MAKPNNGLFGPTWLIGAGGCWFWICNNCNERTSLFHRTVELQLFHIHPHDHRHALVWRWWWWWWWWWLKQTRLIILFYSPTKWTSFPRRERFKSLQLTSPELLTTDEFFLSLVVCTTTCFLLCINLTVNYRYALMAQKRFSPIACVLFEPLLVRRFVQAIKCSWALRNPLE